MGAGAFGLAVTTVPPLGVTEKCCAGVERFGPGVPLAAHCGDGPVSTLVGAAPAGTEVVGKSNGELGEVRQVTVVGVTPLWVGLAEPGDCPVPLSNAITYTAASPATRDNRTKFLLANSRRQSPWRLGTVATSLTRYRCGPRALEGRSRYATFCTHPQADHLGTQ
jgi:hypothetical protein